MGAMVGGSGGGIRVPGAGYQRVLGQLEACKE